MRVKDLLQLLRKLHKNTTGDHSLRFLIAAFFKAFENCISKSFAVNINSFHSEPNQLILNLVDAFEENCI